MRGFPLLPVRGLLVMQSSSCMKVLLSAELSHSMHICVKRKIQMLHLQCCSMANAEISERVKMADVLSRDRSKQADETLQRLASKIRVEYRDFVDALDVPMSCDLGENLRLQLQSIFDILEKGGMKIK